MEYARLEPFGEGRADLRTGLMATLVTVAHGGKHVEPQQWLDPDAWGNAAGGPMTPEELEREAMRWVANSGGKINRRKKNPREKKGKTPPSEQQQGEETQADAAQRDQRQQRDHPQDHVQQDQAPAPAE